MKPQQIFFFHQFLCWLIFRLPFVLSWESLAYLDLGSNLLEGPLSSSICNSKSLEILVLANNKFSGEIPTCLGKFSTSLTALDLRNNSFNGTIPTNFSKDIMLKNLGLNGNYLKGTLPRSLMNCKSLEVLDVGNNNIHYTFPMWLTELPELHVLILRNNKFHGAIGPSKNPFPKLRILDVSYNHFTGTLPSEFLRNLPAMMSVNNEHETKYMGEGYGSYYPESITLVIEGMDVEIHRVSSILTTIDLSRNQFEGLIPESIGNLFTLKWLNLSHNSFNGQIPPALGKLINLESLDLSSNQFVGPIPPNLAYLRALAKFNVSHNHLWGRLPPGTQWTTFGNDWYEGNSGLCGFPLDDCKPKTPPPPPTESSIVKERDCLDLLVGFTWKPVALGYGFGMIVGLLSGSLALFIGQPKSLSKIIGRIKIKKNEMRYTYIFIGK